MMRSDDEPSASQTARVTDDQIQELAARIHQYATDVGPVSIGLLNMKGGAGKTTLTGNLAGEMAHYGLKTLIIGLDPQSDLARDFGLAQTEGGKSLHDAAVGMGEVKITREVRPGIDVIFGDPNLWRLETLVGDNAKDIPEKDIVTSFQKNIQPVLDPYDVVFIDFPPGSPVTQTMALSLTDWIVVPMSTSNVESVVGLEGIVRDARQWNPELRYLGIVTFGYSPREVSLYEEWLEMVEQAAPNIPHLSSRIRYNARIAQNHRLRGLLIREQIEAEKKATKERIAALRTPGAAVPKNRFSSVTHKVAEEYRALAAEILTTILEETK